MKTISIILGSHIFRWAGGSFVAVWQADRADEHVPDDMIAVPEQLVKSRATREDIAALAQSYLTQSRLRKDAP